MNKPMVKSYEQCASRLEQRGWHPPTREYTDGLVDAVREMGVEAVIHSAVSQAGVPLFPTRVFPHPHPKADFDSFRYLLDSLHAIGRPVLSWLPLNHSESVIRAHPDWRMIPIPGEGLPARPAADCDFYVCPCSPYGELLPAFAAEVVGAVGYDGVWFDGSTFALAGNSLPGCVCRWCAGRFRVDTGRPLPVRVDWESDDFRAWVNWRYDILMGLWKRCLDAVLAVNPRATVAFNNYRRMRRNGAWETGIPLKTLGWDALMSGELDLQVFHGDFQMKMHRACRCARGQDSWQALCDHWNIWVPDVELTPVRQAAAACAAAGGVMWMGTGVDLRLTPQVGRMAQETAAPLMPFTGGEPVPYAAIWVGQATQDFYGKARGEETWNGWHGANELCLHAHVPSAVVFDDTVAAGDPNLFRHPVLLAGNTACVSAAQAAQVKRYVEEGGVLVACSDFGSLDEMGHPWEAPPLDVLLGIRSRKPGTKLVTLELRVPELVGACGRWVSGQAPHVAAVPAEEAEILADGVIHGMESWDNREGGNEPMARLPYLWRIKRGKGWIVYSGLDLFAAHLLTPTTFQVKLFRTLMERLAPSPITLAGPLQVTLNVREQSDGAWAVALHNAPGTIWRYRTLFNSGELLPVHNLTVVLRDRRVREAVSGVTGQRFAVSADGLRVTVPVLECADVILLR
jgi:hypothetical protein